MFKDNYSCSIQYSIYLKSICWKEILINARLTELLLIEFTYPQVSFYYANER